MVAHKFAISPGGVFVPENKGVEVIRRRSPLVTLALAGAAFAATDKAAGGGGQYSPLDRPQHPRGGQEPVPPGAFGGPPAQGPGGCAAYPATDMPGRCYRDCKGNLYINAGGQFIEIRNPSSVRVRPMGVQVEVDFSKVATGYSFKLEIQPEIAYFVATSLIIDVDSNLTGGSVDLRKLSLDSIKIGSKEQSIAKSANLQNQAGLSANTAVMASTFAAGAFNNLIDFDVARPELGIVMQCTGRAVPGVTAGSATWSISWFGVTFELDTARKRLATLPKSHGGFCGPSDRRCIMGPHKSGRGRSATRFYPGPFCCQ